MNLSTPSLLRIWRPLFAGLAAVAVTASPLSAQVERVDPNDAYEAPIDGDLEEAPGDRDVYADPRPAEPSVSYPTDEAQTAAPAWSDPASDPVPETQPATPEAQIAPADDPATTYREDDLIGAAEGVFGKGAEGVAKLIQKLLAEQGQPNAYIVGREAGGAFIVGARYGSGTLYHKVEGERPVYWTGPSIGFDAGANAGSTFVLVYNLYDSEELYERYPAGEGQAYAIGGMTASYLRKGDVVLIPIRVGAGLRLGVNAGYMKFSKKQRWLPF
ncbi:MAG: EipA family protein [Erythrobacter sp.]|nr:EipA family protein [Erythrobacter sp.]